MYGTLPDDAWLRILPLLQKHPLVRVNAHTRCFLDAVHWILRTGSQWRALPAHLGNWNSIYRRFRRWSARGIFQDIFDEFSRNADYEWLLIDSTTVRAHMSAAGAPKTSGGQQAQSFGRGRGGFSTKVHIKTDALGLPLELALTPGNRGDMIGVWMVLEPEDSCAQAVMADSAYDAGALREHIEEIGALAVIPRNPTRSVHIEHDQDLYRARHVVECFINKIKWFRRVATRFDKLDVVFLAFLQLASIMVWLR